ncbi:radiation sensitive protein rad9 [Elasticomyces elasticus]|nr:radiation sensitive protein rad9 [Elasticomyces elasticus]KAK3664818.1 radiation sensitive protein rad9 [Elasticomyces elasticus]KAK4928627.1 radiation sensitive protein rad9 [Elasticomyces elasticus]KAK5765196.1 radiation sensitive protein rad9 [Elasticomyces elasticus]
MASLAESSLASVPITQLMALHENLLNHRQPAANAPLDPKPVNEHQTQLDAPKDASEDASAVIPDSADAYQTPNPSSPNANPPRLQSAKSAPPAEMQTMVHIEPSQEGSKVAPRAESFHGFPGGDTQPMDSQVYTNYMESMTAAKSASITPKKTSPDGKQYAYDTTAAGRTPHTYVEGDAGFIDLENAYEPDSPTARSATSGIEELLESQPTQIHILDISQKRTMPETPAMAGHKRRSSGEIVSAEPKKTPGFSQLFGAVPKGPVMSATQLFDQTQALSSPMPDAPRSDPVITRPSPNINGRGTVSSPSAFKSSPSLTRHGRPATFSGEPRDNYTSMQESDERRRIREEEEEQQWRRMGTVEEEVSDIEGEDEGQSRQKQPNRMMRVMSDQTSSEWSKMRAPMRPGSRPGSSRKQEATIDLITPATVRHKGERLDYDELGESDVEMANEEDDLPQPDGDDDGDDENDVYDELNQTVVRSQPNDVEEEEDDSDHASDEEDPDTGDVTNKELETHDESEAIAHTISHNETAVANSAPQAERAIMATQRSAIADSQPLHQEAHRPPPRMSQIQPSSKASFVPGSQYAGKTSEEQAVLRSSQSRRLAASAQESEEQDQRVPSSPPLAEVNSTLPDGSAEASLLRRDVLAQFQKPAAPSRNNIAEQEIPESDALVSDDLRPSTEPSAVDIQVPRIVESNSVPAPFSTAQTHLSTSGPSPTKAHKSPLKMLTSQRSGLSADSPRKLAGVRRFADIAADPVAEVPGDDDDDEEVDLDAIMTDVLTAEDHAFIDAMSSPVTSKPSKRRKLKHDKAANITFESIPPIKPLTMPTAEEGTEESERPVAPVTEMEQELSVEQALPVLRTSQSKGNELPVSTPLNVDTPKSTQESTKKREQAGAAVVSQLLTGRSAKTVKPVKAAKLAGCGRKASGLTELEVNTSNKKVKRVEAESERGRMTSREDVEPVPVKLAGDGTTETVAEPTVVEQGNEAALPITTPRRILALFKGSFNSFYPATWLSTSGDGKTYKVRFDDTSEIAVNVDQVRALEFRVGDHVKVDNKTMRSKVWTIKSLGTPAQTDEQRTSGTDTRGRHLAKVQIRSSRTSLPANKQADESDADLVEVRITDIYLTHSLWPAYADRTFTPPDTSRRNEGRLATPSTGLQTPDIETPGSRSRRKLVPAATMARKKSNLRDESVASSGSRTGTDMFAGMAFAISYGSNEKEREDVIGSILDNGGTILESGFDELFETPDLEGVATTSPKKQSVDAEAHAGLTLKRKYRELGFVALIADRHSRRAKYMQALALGLPTLSKRWIEDSLSDSNSSVGVPLPWAKYLLAAGDSAYLNGAVRSRSIALTPNAADTKLVDTIAQRSKLLNGDGVLIVATTKHKATWDRRKTYAFLTLALGAGHVKRVSDLADAKSLLDVEGENWKWVYVDGSVAEASATLFGSDHVVPASGKKRKRGAEATPKIKVEGKAKAKSMTAASNDGSMKVVNDEFVVQSLILGALVD